MKRLTLHELGPINTLVWPAAEGELDLNLPAVRSFTDFMVHMPSIVHVSEKAVDLAQSMRREHIALKLVVNNYEQLMGIVTLECLSDEEILKKIAEGINRHDLRVRDFLTPKSLLRTLDYVELEQACLGDVLMTLQSEGQRHCLVIDSEEQRVRGIITASEVSRKFNLPLSIQYRSTFADIFNAVHHVKTDLN